MAIVIIPLNQIIIDPSNPIDLSLVPEHEAVELIKESYSFLSSSIKISIKDGTAIIKLEEEEQNRINEAKKNFQKGIKEAQQGDYQKAIKTLSRVLKIIPNDVDARRNLAMAYLELGNFTKAKEHLEKCLKLNPKDSWSLVLIGNIYAKKERNYPVAEFYYEAGLAASPKDNIILNNYAALQMEQGNKVKAIELFERALVVDSSYPNPYYGLACLYKNNHETMEAIAILDQLFDKPKSTDIRSEIVYQKARELYLDLSRELAKQNNAHLMEFVLEEKSKIELVSGQLINIEEDNSLGYISAVAKMGWKHGRDDHQIRYKVNSVEVTPHLLAHELEHIVLEQEARLQGRNRFFITNEETHNYAIRSITDHVAKLNKQGYAEKSINELMDQLIGGLCNQIMNCPLDMVVEQKIYKKYPELHQSQFVSLHNMYLDGVKPLNSPQIKKITPPQIFQASNTLNCAYAIFIDYLYPNRTEYASSYKSTDVFSTGKILFNTWNKRKNDLQPGDEYELVDEFATILKLRSWYAWLPDKTRDLKASKNNDKGTVSLTTDKIEAQLYCVDALRRFEKIDRNEIFTVVSEISILGMSGIDHANPEKIYTLKAYPKESFTGLQLLCLMYVGFQLYDSSIDCGLDFSEAYKIALEINKRATR